MMSLKTLLSLCTIIFSFAAHGNEELIANYGEFKKVDSPDFKVNLKHNYKLVFDVYTTNNESSEFNRGINTVARFINMHLDAGVPLNNMSLALVIHGKAGKDILINDEYNSRFGSNNPNLPLLDALIKKGVNVIVCGQTLGFNNYSRKSVIPGVNVSLSAMTALAELQNHGYGQINFN